MKGALLMAATVKDLIMAVKGNDVKGVKRMLESMGMLTTAPLGFDNQNKRIVQYVYAILLSMAYDSEFLSDELVDTVFAHTSQAVALFAFVGRIVDAAKIQIDDFSILPRELYDNLINDTNEEASVQLIESLNDEEFETLLAFLASSKVEVASCDFAYPILKRLYKGEIVKKDFLLATIGLCLTTSYEDVLEETLKEHAMKTFTAIAGRSPFHS